MTGPLTVEPIGFIRTGYTDRALTPVQTALNPDDRGEVIVHAAYRDGLADLDGFDFVWLLTWLVPSPDDPDPPKMRQTPFLLRHDPRLIGLFAMRGPRRPNPIGLHLVRLLDLTGDGFTFAGVDMLDGTAVLDIKPWAVPFDIPSGFGLDREIRSGWLDTVDLRVGRSSPGS